MKHFKNGLFWCDTKTAIYFLVPFKLSSCLVLLRTKKLTNAAFNCPAFESNAATFIAFNCKVNFTAFSLLQPNLLHMSHGAALLH